MAEPRRAVWRPGTRVQVRNRFDGSWVSGFEVTEPSEREPITYRVRRRSDRTVLPATFASNELRPEGSVRAAE